MNTLRWPYTEPYFAFPRYGVRLQGVGVVKGVQLEDLYEQAEAMGGEPVQQTVVVVTGGPDAGHEVIGPWRPRPSPMRESRHG